MSKVNGIIIKKETLVNSFFAFYANMQLDYLL